jgi:hypothetical protein
MALSDRFVKVQHNSQRENIPTIRHYFDASQRFEALFLGDAKPTVLPLWPANGVIVSAPG